MASDDGVFVEMRKHLFRRKSLLTLGFFTVGGAALLFTAVYGDSTERLFVAIWATGLGMILALFLALYSGLLDDTLVLSTELLDAWKTDSDYAHDVTADYVRVLGELYEHDPAKADFFRERLADYALTRHPDLAVWIEEQMERAGWN